MCFIYGCSDEKIQFRTLFDEKFCQTGRAVICIQLIKKLFIKLISCVFFQKFQALSHSQHSLCHKVDPFDHRHRRHIRIPAVDFRSNLSAEHPRGDICACPACHYFLSFRVHKVMHQTFIVLLVFRRPGKYIDHPALNDSCHRYRRIVSRLLLIKLITRLTQHHCQPRC